jgi:2,5-dihydroxypyridine 5,6-dioxygenase
MKSDADLIPLFRRELELCRVGERDVVGLLTDGQTRPEYIAATAGAAASLGAKVFEVCVPSLGWDLPASIRGMAAGTPALAKQSDLLEAVFAGLSKATFVADLIGETIIHVPVRSRLQRAGARVLTINEPADVLERMFPTEEIRAQVESVSAAFAGASRLHLTSAAGTDLVYELNDETPFSQYGYSDIPGKWDHWPSALTTVYPLDDICTGVVVLQPGDVMLPLKRYVASAVRLTIEAGYVIEIDGDLDAELIRGFLDAWGEPAAYAVSHIGIGLHPRAQWSSLALHEKQESIGMDARCMLGGFIFSTGPNRHTGRLVEAHMDFPMRNCTVTVDGAPLISAGELVPSTLEPRAIA